jgi:F-type H+-transporting ATPase subunit alpha
MVLFAGINGYLDDIPTGDIRRFEEEFLAFVYENYPDVPHDIDHTKNLPEAAEKKLHEAVKAFKAKFKAGS